MLFEKLNFTVDRFKYLKFIDEVINPQNLWINQYGTSLFRLSEYDISWITSDPYLKRISEYFDNWKMMLYRMPPKTFLPWHSDTKFRNSAINALLNNFEQSAVYYDVTFAGSYALNFTEVKYEPNVVYALNVDVPHTVFNYADTDRYLLTYTLRSGIYCEDIVNFCRNEFK